MDKTCLTLVLMKPSPKTPAAALRQKQGTRIRTQRDFLDMSQSALAERCGVTKAAVSEWERGTSSPRQHLQVRIAEALRTPWSNLFGLDGESAA